MSLIDDVLGEDSGMPIRGDAATAATAAARMPMSQRQALEAKAREHDALAAAHRREAKAIRARLASDAQFESVTTKKSRETSKIRSTRSQTVHLQNAVDELRLRYAGLTNNMLRVPTPNKPEWSKQPKQLTESEKRKAREVYYEQLLVWLAREREDLMTSIRIAEDGIL